MFVVNEMPVQVDASLLQLLAEVEPATVGHFRHWGFMDPGLRPVIPGRRAVGTAVTLRVPGPDGTIQNYALGQVRRGDFLLIDRCGDTRHASWGGLTSVAARELGVAGVVTDGVACDFEEIRVAGVPVWCRGSSAVTCKMLGLAGEMNVPISCGGVNVRPGDIVLADESGILVLDPSEARAVGAKALEMQQKEKELIAQLIAGKKLPDLTGSATLVRERLGAQKM